jgi:cysteine desulfurase / selenocysteine lyase
VVTNNAASTQPPRELLELYRSLTPGYENVHRGQSSASQRMTELFEASYDTFAAWLHAPSRCNIVTYRNTTEAINAVMYLLLSEFLTATTLSPPWCRRMFSFSAQRSRGVDAILRRSS